MSSNALLSDPVLAFLDPADLVKLKGISKEFFSTIETYQSNKTFWNTDTLSIQPWQIRKKLYALYPNITRLEMTAKFPYTLKEYLRPSLQTLDLSIVFSFELSSNRRSLYLLNYLSLRDTLRDLQDFLRTNPETSLKTFSLHIAKEVFISGTEKDRFHVGYDKYGPLYEDEDWRESVDYFDPFGFLEFLNEHGVNQVQRLTEQLQQLEAMQLWNHFEVPSLLPQDDFYSNEIQEFLHSLPRQ
jgi:hypothetical protein